jgi:hypothetical protein
VGVLITPLKCEGRGRNKAENLPFATNPTGQNPDLKAKITSKIESKNVFAFLKLFRFRVDSVDIPRF